MRVAIISTPRSGNSWLRFLLAETLGIPELAIHNWHDIMDNVPESLVLHIHWYREPGFQKFLRDNGFKTVTLARHPLDVLLSVLRLCKHDPTSVRWLEDNCNLQCLFDKSVTPVSKEFLNWCKGFGCENLLSISYQWFHDPHAIKLHYEDLILDPRGVVGTLASRIAGSSLSVPDAALEKYNLSFFKGLPNKHGWQGKAGLWKDFYSWPACRKIYRRHWRVFKVLGYGIKGASWMTSTKKILKRWKELNPDDPAPVPAAAG